MSRRSGAAPIRIMILALLTVALTGCVTVVPAATDRPTLAPTATPEPTLAPTPEPTPVPISTPEPTPSPTAEPAPTATADSTETPSGTPDPNATPRPTVVDLLPYLSSQVTVLNLAAEPLTLTVTLVDTESSDEYQVGVFDIQPDQVTTQAIIPSRFRLDFEYAGGAVPDGGTCTIDIAEGEQLQFATVASGIVMTSNGTEPVDAAEMLVATSSRCHAGETT